MNVGRLGPAYAVELEQRRNRLKRMLKNDHKISNIGPPEEQMVAEWMRVGYCQGNLNSDNAALGGVTLDFGPFAFMEKYATYYNPWVGGGLPYSFGKQPQATISSTRSSPVQPSGSDRGVRERDRSSLWGQSRRA